MQNEVKIGIFLAGVANGIHSFISHLKYIHRLVVLCLITNGRQNMLLLRRDHLQC